MHLMDMYETWRRHTSVGDRMTEHATVLQLIVQQMLKDGTHDLGYIRALVTQAGNPRWRGEPLKLKSVVVAEARESGDV